MAKELCVFVFVQYVCACLYVFTCLVVCMCVYVSVCICVCVCVCICACLCVYRLFGVYMHACAHKAVWHGLPINILKAVLRILLADVLQLSYFICTVFVKNIARNIHAYLHTVY